MKTPLAIIQTRNKTLNIRPVAGGENLLDFHSLIVTNQDWAPEANSTLTTIKSTIVSRDPSSMSMSVHMISGGDSWTSQRRRKGL